jgi:hypothetical protein
MKRLLAVLTLVAGLAAVTNAQTTNNHADSDYERLVQKRLEVNFRNYAINALELDEPAINEFDEVYKSYMRDKSSLIDQKYELLDKYVASVKKGKKDKEEELTDFIEDYWETEIDEMKVEKRYFDNMSEELGLAKTTQFFLLEDALQNRLKNRIYAKDMPLLIRIERFSVFDDKAKLSDGWAKRSKKQYADAGMVKRPAVTSYINWVQMIYPNDVTFSNEYVAQGIKGLTGAVKALIESSDEWSVKNLDVRTENIMKIADQLAETEVKNEKADIAKVAFLNVASILHDLQNEYGLDYVNIEIRQLDITANDIYESEMLQEQPDQVYQFFKETASVLEQLSWDVDWSSDKKQMDYNQR